MNKRFILLCVGIIGLSFFKLNAQMDLADPLMPVEKKPNFYLGPVLGYNKSMHTVELKTFAQDPLCPTFIDGSSNGFFGGLSFEYLFGEAETSNSSIIARLLYNSMPASMEQNDLDLPTRVIQISGRDTVETIEYTSIIHKNEVKYNLVTFEVMYKFNPIYGNGLGLVVGPTFDFALTKTQEQRMDLMRPLNAQFRRDPDAAAKGYRYENNDRSIVIQDGDIPNSSAFRLGLKFGVQYEVLMKGGMYIVPSVHYNFGITNLNSDFDWRVNALQIGVDLRFSFISLF